MEFVITNVKMEDGRSAVIGVSEYKGTLAMRLSAKTDKYFTRGSMYVFSTIEEVNELIHGLQIMQDDWMNYLTKKAEESEVVTLSAEEYARFEAFRASEAELKKAKKKTAKKKTAKK